MAPFETAKEKRARLTRELETVDSRIEEEERLCQAISEKQAELGELKIQLTNFLTENGTTDITSAPAPPKITQIAMPVRSRGMTATPAPVEPATDVEDPDTDTGAAELQAGSDDQDALQDQSEPSDCTLSTSTPFRRNTRASLAKSGYQIESPEKPKSMLVQLCDKKSSINILDNGNYVDTACHVCGVNMPRQPTKFYVNNRFDLAGLREHYRLRHGVSVPDENAIFNVCTRTVLTDQDIADILNGRVPANEMLRDRVGDASKKSRSKAKARVGENDTSDPSAASSSNEDSIMTDSNTSASSAGIAQANPSGVADTTQPSERYGVTAETLGQAHPANYFGVPAPSLRVNANGNASSNGSLKRKERSDGGDKENAPPAVQRRARVSDSGDEFEVGSWR